MIKAVLLDLDDTLLRCSDRVFVPEYLRLIDQHFLTKWDFPHLSQTLRQFIHAAAGPRDSRQTNNALAEAIIAEATRRSPQEIGDAFASFYAQVYPQLAGCVEAVPHAAELFTTLRQQQYAVVIATNPLYPAEAIRQRLAWAGLADDLAAYALVTHSGNMHFTKPDPAYYAEIIARVGVEPDEALMVGDSLTNDMRPAAVLGLSTYGVNENHLEEQPEDVDQAGGLTQFYELVQHEGWADKFVPRPPKPEAIEPQLRGNLGALFGLLDGVQPNHWHQRPDPNEWSILEIVCHLLESEDRVQRPRLERILLEDNPFLSAPKPPPGPGAVQPCDDDGDHAAKRFAERRQQTIDWLQQLTPGDWHRPARHSIFGLTSLLEMAHFTAQHDRLHLNQLCQTQGRCEG
ncbi:MAG: HAD-IA family hydrolase [Anaerolineae bacterium]|nr:HAD-IA family hydrolase [Anaerolineae bacterium]